jgi:hypothetical protein
MLYGRVGIFAALVKLAAALATLAAVPAEAQSVISTHSGVIHFFEGTVFLGDQPLESHLGRYPSVPEGTDLRTADGRAEVLLTPGVFLRMNDHSAIRMVANDLADTQVELLGGSIIVESGEPNSGTSVTLIYQNWRAHLVRQGTYRMDSDPARLWVRQGELEVFAGDDGSPVTVEAGMSLPFADSLAPERSVGEPGDALRDWTAGRRESIAADDAITAQIDEDPPSLTIDAGNPIYFPVLGVLSPGVDPTGLYSSVALYQPGFSSIYLPGYTYRPLVISLVGRGLQTYGLQTYPLRPRVPIGISPGVGVITPLPRLPLVLPPVPHPAPAPVHMPTPMPARIGGGRR